MSTGIFSPPAGVSMETIQLLAMESQRGGFWPRLSRLRCNVGWNIVPFVSLFLTPTITDLDLTLPRESNRLLQPTLSLFAHACRCLETLKLDVDTSCALSSGEIGRLISASRNTLYHIDIKPFTPAEIFPAIFDLPRLRCLILQEPRFPHQIPPDISSHLETININLSGKHGSNLNLFLWRLPFQKLSDVSIAGSGAIQLSPLLNSLRGAATTMATLYLSRVAALDPSSVTLLCSFINLTSLTILCVCEHNQPNLPCTFQPTDKDISELGGALPHIRTLGFGTGLSMGWGTGWGMGWGPGCHSSPLATFASLLSLSRTCGHLENLAIRVDFMSIVGGSDQPDHPSLRTNGAHPPGTRSRLGTLDVGNSPLPDTHNCEWVVALALASIFPSVQYLHSTCTGKMRNRWDQVWRDILACRRVMNITQVAGEHLSALVL